MKLDIHLAPMEGVVDFNLRDVLTLAGGIDQCVTEFIRVTDKLLTPAVILKYAPELNMNCRTRAGTPMFLQFLGGQAGPLAENAAQAAELGALGIDLNFGCPAKTVNRHDGGASLLKTPERIFNIVSKVRAAVPASIPVTAKMRLGFEDPSHCFANAEAVSAAQASWVTIHCRTKTDGYRPPAFWEWIPQIKEKIQIPVIANGEIWTTEDFERCQNITGCDRFMIGRGLVANPFLARQIKTAWSKEQSDPQPTVDPRVHLTDPSTQQSSWNEISALLPGFFKACSENKSAYFAQARTKQWLKALSLRNQAANELFNQLKVITNPIEFRTKLESSTFLI